MSQASITPVCTDEKSILQVQEAEWPGSGHQPVDGRAGIQAKAVPTPRLPIFCGTWGLSSVSQGFTGLGAAGNSAKMLSTQQVVSMPTALSQL